MVFSSILFLFQFLPIMIILYYIFPDRYKNAVLFLGSLIFYSWGEPVYVLLLLFSTAVDYVHGILIEKFNRKNCKKMAQLVLCSSVVINLFLLAFFKYGTLFFKDFTVALPIGISFYTFQTMSYTIDVYRRKVRPQKNIISFGAYVSLFPQLIAGPIVRYQEIEKELTGRNETFAMFASGIQRFMIGLGKKVMIANQMGTLYHEIQNTCLDERSVVMMWVGLFAFGMQMYYDFSGYSDMAIGLGRMFGFHFPENFKYPYCAESITDFWRRWHMTLGTWFREYVYIPLGGNRRGRKIQIRNIMVVWLLTGLWHGAGLNYVLWGLYFGILLLLEKNKILPQRNRFYAMMAVFFGWILFANENLMEGIQFFGQLFGFYSVPFVNRQTMYLMGNYLIIGVAACAGSTPFPKTIWNRYLKRWNLPAIIMTFFLCIAALVNAGYNPFLYFRF